MTKKGVKPVRGEAQSWQPEEYQLEGCKFLLEHAAAGLFLAPGLRKTSTTLAAIKILKKEKLLKRVLIIAPLRVCYSVWPKEIQKWKDFNHLRVEILHGPDKEAALKRDADIYLINPEGLSWLFGVTTTKTPGGKKSVITYDLKNFKQLGVDTLIVDEISKFKHSNSGRFQVLKPHLNKFARRWGLTGSPAPNGLLDLFGIMYVLDLGRSLGQYITHYRASYFYPTGYGGYTWALRPEAEEQIYERIGPVVYRIAEEDYLKLPKLVENTIKIELPKPVRKIYDELENDLITMLEDNTVTAVNAAVASVKCSQVANGGLFLNQEINDLGQKVGKREWQNLHEEKLDAVEDIIEELNGAPVIVVYDYEHDLERLLKRFGKDTPVIGGGVSPKKSDQIVDAWNRGEIPILLGHPQAMSHGLNLQDNNSQHIIWHSICWDYELFDQLTRRLLRSGNTSEKVFNHFIVAKDTVDEAKLLALKRKKRTQGSLLDAMKEYSQQRRLQRSGK